MNSSRPVPNLFYGWWIVAAGFVTTMLAIGSTTYAFGLFVKPLSEEFGLSRADANIGFIALLIGFALWAPLVGRVLDRSPARMVMCVGGLLVGIGFSLIAVLKSPTAMALVVVGPLALGTVACGALATNAITARWFYRQRGRAMGLLAVATSAGGFTVPPVAALLMEQYGWRGAVGVLGVAIPLLVIAVVLWRIRDRPQDLGLLPDGGVSSVTTAADGTQPAAVEGRQWRFGQLLADGRFWLIALGTGLLLGADQALLASLIPYGIDAGYGAPRAALLLSCLTFSAILGKLAIGALADRYDKRLLFCIVAACNLSFLLLLLFEPSYPVLVAACCVIGLAIGGTYPLWTTLIADHFGAASFGTVMGSMNLAMMPLAIGAIRFIGVVHDRTGSYNDAFLVFIATAFVAVALILMLRPRPPA
ncbi:MAG TPA: MFS transporter [Solimonas sp.]